MSFNSLTRFAEALPPPRRSLEVDPNVVNSHQRLGRACWFLGDREASLVELNLSGSGAGALRGGWPSAADSTRTGRVHDPRPPRPYFLSHLHAALGEDDLAFAALEQALVERESLLRWLPVQRSFNDLASLESDPRWQMFIEKVKAAVQAGGSARS